MASSSWSDIVARAPFSLEDLIPSQKDDSRVGAAKDGASGGTVSTNAGNKSSSLTQLGSTFIPVVVFSTVCILIFITTRRLSPRVYAPRSLPSLRAPHSPTPALPSGWFNWIKPFFQIPDSFLLRNGSMDGFFFLRYLKVLRNMFLVGILISWPVLFPIHATGGNGLKQLDMLTIGNVSDPRRMYAHVAVAYLFFGFVLFTIVRECIYYINIRQAYLSSPHFANRLSSRTLLLTSVPQRYLDEARLRKLYGDSVKQVWIPRTAKILVKLVKEREETARRLEKAEIDLIRKANIIRAKKERASSTSTPSPAPSSTEWVIGSPSSGSDEPSSMQDEFEARIRTIEGEGAVVTEAKSNVTQITRVPDSPTDPNEKLEDPDYIHPYGLSPDIPDVRGSVAAQWIPASKRPHHRPLGNYCRRVDTIRWTRMRLGELNREIYKLRRIIRRGDGTTLEAAFIEFDTQENAQAAHQVVAHHRPLQLAPRILGIRPDEIVWSSLRMKWWERIMRRFAIMGLITAAVIFWSIPCAIIGIVSNIEFLSGIVFLKWIALLPKPITGFLQGFVPAIALTFWMSLVPAMLRFCAVQAGVPSVVLVELFTQHAYFAFQVVQVFLITTLTSAASASLEKILKEPLSAKDLLAENLPKASNFYLSYILVQCLFIGSTSLLQVFELIRHHIFAKIARIPRRRFEIWYNLRPPRWGGVFPVFSNMAVIAFSYSCIAPLILVFAAAGLGFMRLIYRYNILFVFDSEMDSKGLFYPRGLLHLFVGLYMAQICMIGLLALKLAIVPMVLIIVFLVFTGLVHLTIREAIAPLLQNLPQTLSIEEDFQQEDKAASQAGMQAAAEEGNMGAANDYYDAQQIFGDEEPEATDEEDDEHEPVTAANNRGMEGAGAFGLMASDWVKSSARDKLKAEVDGSPVVRYLKKLKLFGGKGDPDKPPNFVERWFHPEIYDDFVAIRKKIPEGNFPDLDDTEDSTLGSYWPPELWTPKPVLWIPRDEARVSRQEVAHSRKAVPITDRGAWISERGNVTVEVEEAPFPRRRLLH